jgi:hypothetical protein
VFEALELELDDGVLLELVPELPEAVEPELVAAVLEPELPELAALVLAELPLFVSWLRFDNFFFRALICCLSARACSDSCIA